MNRRSFNLLALGLAFVGLGGLPPGADAETISGVNANPTSFTTYLGPQWTLLVGRAGPNQSSATKREYYAGQPIKVTHETTHGQAISRGRSYGYGSSVWYYTSDGCWVWSGGTNRPVWNTKD